MNNRDFILDESKLEFCHKLGYVTLVGNYFNEEKGMWDRGNCFSLRSDEREYKIVNFGYENLKMLIDMNIIKFPIRIWKLSDNVAIIHDERIDNRFYWDGFCEICCPYEFLPLPQKLARDLNVRRGVVVHHGNIITYNMKDKYEGCGIPRLSSGTWNELMENEKQRKEAYLKPFVDYYKNKCSRVL